MKDRIRQLMEAQHMNQQSFAGSIGISNATLSSIFNGRTNPTNKIVEAIHNTFPNVRTDWLMWGTGPMFVMNDAAASGSADMEQSPRVPAADQAPNSPIAMDLFGSAKMAEPQRHPAPNQASQEYIVSPSAATVQRKITEIRVFYDDQTWESFTPKK